MARAVLNPEQGFMGAREQRSGREQGLKDTGETQPAEMTASPRLILLQVGLGRLMLGVELAEIVEKGLQGHVFFRCCVTAKRCYRSPLRGKKTKSR